MLIGDVSKNVYVFVTGKNPEMPLVKVVSKSGKLLPATL
jgi:hypothetical protein